MKSPNRSLTAMRHVKEPPDSEVAQVIVEWHHCLDITVSGFYILP